MVWVGGGGLGVIIESNLNQVRLSCCWVGVGLGSDNISFFGLDIVPPAENYASYSGWWIYIDLRTHNPVLISN